MIRIPVIALVLAAALSQSPSQDQQASLRTLLLEGGRIQGLSKIDTTMIYEGKELFDFIDGGADLFFEYGFRRALAAEYQTAGGETINLEIYEMADPGAAFGIYSIRSGEEAIPVGIGQGGSAHAYYLMFWKGRFYVSVASSDSTAECKSGLEAIARAVDQSLSERGQKPHIVELLPADTVRMSRYFRGPLGLSSTRVLDLNGIFPIVDGAVGTYTAYTIVLLRYGSAPGAGAHLADFSTNIKTDERFTGYQHRGQITVVADRKNHSVCFGQSDSYIVISISSENIIAEASCMEAISLIRGQ